jgi:transcriptional regulator with XRE-family HTH domain
LDFKVRNESPRAHTGIRDGLAGDYMTKKITEAGDRRASERLSHALRAVRVTKNVSMVAVAEATGISRNTLFLIETKAANARLSTIDSLAAFWNVDPSQLLENFPRLTPLLSAREPLSKIVAQNIAAFRITIGLSQEELGAAAGLAKNYVSLIEVTSPDLRIETVDSIAKALGIDVTFLIADSREGRS